jgi:tetratricopeptide (TPR) repeat protein
MELIQPANSPPPFLDVPTLLELSQPRARINWIWYALGALMLLLFSSTFSSAEKPGVKQAIQAVSLFVLISLMAAMALTTMYTVRKYRAAQQSVESIEELIQLRRWDQAAMALQAFLTQPARTARLRAQALIYLASLLARYHRFEDAITVQNHLLETEMVDDMSGYGLRLGRAMAMLHEDHLLDADKAIGDLRRRGSDQSGGLALVEIYRDVKTGHPAEAIQIFMDKLDLIRRQFGHRVADAHVLAAKAYDLMGKEAEAQAAYERATLLSPLAELQRRYPEVTNLGEKYKAATAPAEAA